MEESELIDNYLQGKLSEAELGFVESKIANDKDFKRKLILRKAIMAGINEGYTEELKKRLTEFDHSLETKKFTIQISWKMVAVITGTVLVVTATVLFFLYRSSSQSLKGYDLVEIGVPNVMGSTKSSVEFVNAMNHFKAGSYAKALAGFQEQLQRYPANDTLQYFVGVAAYRTGHTDLAIKLFSTIPVSSGYFEISEYRLGLCYLADNQRDRAFEHFSAIVKKQEHKYKMETLRVLSEQF
ncbi:MAG: tetratricopeptide repeat protein [Bacteroidetes bacterium]|nr:tetratricopeptide repeat protein [Bacteroidota bacterium]MBS1980779.1 tetratricopeptide repeat protein [Bacteroidota bacterium]